MGESSEKGSDPDQEVEDIAEELSQEDGVNHCVSFNGADEALAYLEGKLEEELELARLRKESNSKLGIFKKNSA